jgi:hypothetical protein
VSEPRGQLRLLIEALVGYLEFRLQKRSKPETQDSQVSAIGYPTDVRSQNPPNTSIECCIQQEAVSFLVIEIVKEHTAVFPFQLDVEKKFKFGIFPRRCQKSLVIYAL